MKLRKRKFLATLSRAVGGGYRQLLARVNAEVLFFAR